MINTTFSKKERLDKLEFRKVFSEGKRFSDLALTVYILSSRERRIGFVLGKKIRPVVRRNRLKRLMREIYRKNKHRMRENVMVVVVMREAPCGTGFVELEASFLKLLKRARVL